MCVQSIKVPIRKKSGNLFNDPRIFLERKKCHAYSFIFIIVHISFTTAIKQQNLGQLLYQMDHETKKTNKKTF